MSALPLVLAVASGKGGVGKTMLSVACARELSLQGRTLLVDLDFFNRGLTGLLPRKEGIGRVDPPGFLGQVEADASWEIVQARENLLYISYPDLLPAALAHLESVEVLAMRDALREFIVNAADRFRCDAVVLDCHGGPDRASFAAALVADHTLLVSEPDRITFYGTFNFLRQLQRVMPADARPPDLRLVFNKVLPVLRTRFLRRIYHKYLREDFAGRDLLAIFPLEVYLTKAFEETPVLTDIYPHSLLARKMRVLLRDLLHGERDDVLAPGIIHLNRLALWHRRTTLGKAPWYVDLQNVFTAVGVGAALLGLVYLCGKEYSQCVPKVHEAAVRVTLYTALHDADVQKKFQAASPADRELAYQLFEHYLAGERLDYLTRGPIIFDRATEIYSTNADSPEANPLLHLPARREQREIFGREFSLVNSHGRNSYGAAFFNPVMGNLLHGRVRLPSPEACPEAKEAMGELRAVAGDRLLLVLFWASVALDALSNAGPYVAIAWILLAALWGYQTRLDTALTRAVRGWHYPSAVLITGGILAVWILPIYLLANKSSIFLESVSNGAEIVGRDVGGGLLVVTITILVGRMLWLLYRVVWRERCRREAAWRSLLLVLLTLLTWVLRVLE